MNNLLGGLNTVLTGGIGGVIFFGTWLLLVSRFFLGLDVFGG